MANSNEYNFTLRDATYHSCWNGYAIVNYPYKYKKGKIHTRQYVIDSDNNCINIPEKIWVRWVTKNNKLICHYQNVKKYESELVLMDFNDNVIIKPFDYDDFEIIDFGTPNSAEKFFKVKKGNKYGLLEDSGKVLITPQYCNLEEAGNGLLIAQKSKYRYGLVDVLGNIIVPFNYSNIYVIGLKYFTAKYKGKWGLYDYENNNIISPRYQAFYFYEEYGVAKFSGKWGIVDINNNCLTGFIFDDADVNVDDIQWLPIGYDYVLDRQKTKRYAASKCSGRKSEPLEVNVRMNKKWGMYSLVTGKQIIPLEYDELCYFYDGLCRVRQYTDKNHKYESLINRKNEIVLGFNMSRDEECFWEYPYEGMWKYKNYGKYKFISTENPNKHSNRSFDEARQYNEGLVAVSLYNHWGFVDKNENIVIPIIFDEVSNFADGRAFVNINGKSGFIDKEGKEIKIFRK